MTLKIHMLHDVITCFCLKSQVENMKYEKAQLKNFLVLQLGFRVSFYAIKCTETKENHSVYRDELVIIEQG